MISLKRFLKEGDSRSLTAKKNIIGSIAVKGLSIAIQLMLVPMTLGYLSEELYGIWLTVSSIILWINFFDVGFTLGLKNRLTEALANKDYARGKALVSTTYVMLCVIFIPLAIICEMLIPQVNWSAFLNVSPEYNEQLVSVVSVMLVSVCLQMIFHTISSILGAFQKVAFASALPVIGNLCSLIVIFILTKTTAPSLLKLAWSISYLPTLVMLISSVILFGGKFKCVAPSLRCFHKKYIRQLFSLGAKFFIIQIQMLVVYQTTNILISNLSSPIDVTEYNIAYKYISGAMMFFIIILGPLWPAFTDAYIKKDFAWMRNVYHRMKRVYYLLFIGIILMTILSPFAYHIWIGNEATISSIMTTSVAIYTLIYSWDTLQLYLLNGIGTIQIQTYVTTIGLIIHIPLSLFLGRTCNCGALGVVYSMTLIEIIKAATFTIQLRKILNQKANGIWIK